MFDARNLSPAAKKICKAEKMTPRWYEPLNANRPVDDNINEPQPFPVLRIWNSRREIVVTNADLAYANEYL